MTARENINKKKTFSVGHCPNHLNPNQHIFSSTLYFLDGQYEVYTVCGSQESCAVKVARRVIRKVPPT